MSGEFGDHIRVFALSLTHNSRSCGSSQSGGGNHLTAGIIANAPGNVLTPSLCSPVSRQCYHGLRNCKVHVRRSEGAI